MHKFSILAVICLACHIPCCLWENYWNWKYTPSAAYRMRCMMSCISVRKLLSSNIYQNMQSLLFNKLNFNIYFYDVAAPGGCPNSGSLARLFWQNGCSGVRSIRCINNFGRFPGFGCEPSECGHFPIEWYRKKNLWQGVGGCFSRAEWRKNVLFCKRWGRPLTGLAPKYEKAIVSAGIHAYPQD